MDSEEWLPLIELDGRLSSTAKDLAEVYAEHAFEDLVGSIPWAKQSAAVGGDPDDYTFDVDAGGEPFTTGTLGLVCDAGEELVKGGWIEPVHRSPGIWRLKAGKR